VTNFVVPGHTITVNVAAGDQSSLFGLHCAAGIGGTVTIILSSELTYTGPAANALTPTTVNGDTLTYNIPDFGAINYAQAFNFNATVDTSAIIGAIICFSCNISPLNDYNPGNNDLTQCFIVRGSCDPNEKTVWPANVFDLALNDWLTYTIHFQNTGTAQADNIYILDTLDTELDPSTFTLLSYSHPVATQVFSNRVVKFSFPNINLPDSTSNEPNSHGYVQYKIKPTSTVAVGHQISNTAAIYFDYNAPVLTNTISNTVVYSLGLPSLQPLDVSVHPNPSRDQFIVNYTSSTLVGKTTLTVYDALGRVISKGESTSPSAILDASSWAPGIYFLTITADGQSKAAKLVKE
jgi:uncharacterized repeat protein (TIGR01451 family)